MQWRAAGIQGTTILSALERNHGYRGSTSSIYRFLKQIKVAEVPDVPMRLEFKPGEAAQIQHSVITKYQFLWISPVCHIG